MTNVLAVGGPFADLCRDLSRAASILTHDGDRRSRVAI